MSFFFETGRSRYIFLYVFFSLCSRGTPRTHTEKPRVREGQLALLAPANNPRPRSRCRRRRRRWRRGEGPGRRKGGGGNQRVPPLPPSPPSSPPRRTPAPNQPPLAAHRPTSHRLSVSCFFFATTKINHSRSPVALVAFGGLGRRQRRALTGDKERVGRSQRGADDTSRDGAPVRDVAAVDFRAVTRFSARLKIRVLSRVGRRWTRKKTMPFFGIKKTKKKTGGHSHTVHSPPFTRQRETSVPSVTLQSRRWQLLR